MSIAATRQAANEGTPWQPCPKQQRAARNRVPEVDGGPGCPERFTRRCTMGGGVGAQKHTMLTIKNKAATRKSATRKLTTRSMMRTTGVSNSSKVSSRSCHRPCRVITPRCTPGGAVDEARNEGVVFSLVSPLPMTGVQTPFLTAERKTRMTHRDPAINACITRVCNPPCACAASAAHTHPSAFVSASQIVTLF